MKVIDTTYLEFCKTSHGKIHVGTLEDGMICKVQLNVEPETLGQTLPGDTQDNLCTRCFVRGQVEYVKPQPYWTL